MNKIILILLMVILIFLVGCEPVEEEEVGEQIEEVGFAGITKQQCDQAEMAGIGNRPESSEKAKHVAW